MSLATVGVIRRSASRWVWAPAALAAAVVLGALIPLGVGLQTALAATVIVVAMALALTNRLLLLGTFFVWLVALGFLRRILAVDTGSSAIGDPLLLVAPAVWILFALVASSQGAFKNRTRLGDALLAFSAVLTVSALNPLQGGPSVGLGGWLITVPPILAFWLGRTLSDRAIRVLGVLIVTLATGSVVYGLVQTYDGLPSWDEHYVQTSGYAALDITASVIRAFGPFTSAQEYVTFVAVALIIAVVGLRRLALWPICVPLIGLFATAIWLESSRGILVYTAAAVVVVLAARGRLSWPGVILLVVAITAIAPYTISHLVATPAAGAQGTAALGAHQVSGLTDPFSQTSTLPGHLARLTHGIVSAFTQPLGTGVGAVTRAGTKFGGASGGTETDLGNVGVATGAVGLLLFAYILVAGLAGSYRLARSGSTTGQLAVGILMAMFAQWLGGGEYAVAGLPWLMLGAIDARMLTPSGPLGDSNEDDVGKSHIRPSPLTLNHFRPTAPDRAVSSL